MEYELLRYPPYRHVQLFTRDCLMDMQMPEMDGDTATCEIRKLDLAYQPLIIAMTANASESDKKACLDAGMDSFLSKPIKVELLRETLKSAF